ncbi:MAG: hypothetical protein HY925_14210 [Elusimicrobia bacterium]|nr:hypothetical protein [Elusimicrobiota bacterium]
MAISRYRRLALLLGALSAAVTQVSAQQVSRVLPGSVLEGAAVPGARVSNAPSLSLPQSFVAPALARPSILSAVLAPNLRAVLRSGRVAAAEPLAGPASAGRAHALRLEVEAQLAAMRREVGDDSDLAKVAADAAPLLDAIEAHLREGAIDPDAALRYSSDDAAVPVRERAVRVGVYPVAADPFQWAHILIGLQAIAKLKLDKVVFILAGDDPRKPTMTPASVRHPMGRSVLERFAPFFAFSPIAQGTLYDGETNIFRLLALNPEQKIEAFYMVGDDHYKLVDKKGNPDTLPKLEANMGKLLVDAARHKVLVAFNEREGRGEEVPTSLDVTFLPRMSFDASSTLVRGGKFALMPHAAYDHVRETGSGLYGIAPAKPKP